MCKNQKTIVELKNQVIVLVLSFPGGHVEVAGRVRYIPASPAVWVGSCCLRPDMIVTRSAGDDPDHWSALAKSTD